MKTHYSKVVITQCETFPELIGAIGFFDKFGPIAPRGLHGGIFAPCNGYNDILLQQYYVRACKFTLVYEPSIFDFNCRALPKVIITSVDKNDAYYYQKDNFVGLLGYLEVFNNGYYLDHVESGRVISGNFYPFIRGTRQLSLDCYYFNRVTVQELKGKQ